MSTPWNDPRRGPGRPENAERRAGRPSNADRRAELLQRLSEAGRRMSDAAVMFHTALAGRLGLGASEWKTLGLLERHGPLTAGDLSVRSGLAPASVTGIVDRLEARGWVHRERDPADRRRVVVTLDPAGTARDAAECFAGLRRRLDELYDRYDEDELSLILEAMTEIAERQGAATAELEGDSSALGRADPP